MLGGPRVRDRVDQREPSSGDGERLVRARRQAHGPGSATPLADGSAPSGEYTVKGNADSMLFHTIESPYYGRTKAEVWFKNEKDAEAAGFTAWNRRR